MTNIVETTRRAMYQCLDRIRRAAKHRKLTLEFEGCLEAHLEALRQEQTLSFAEQMRAERDDLQARLASVDAAHAKSEETLRLAGEEIRRLHVELADWKKDANDSDDKVEQLSVKVRELEIVVRNQRQGYAELFMETRQQQAAQFSRESELTLSQIFKSHQMARGR
jgi:chromosome segregation ATPase